MDELRNLERRFFRLIAQPQAVEDAERGFRAADPSFPDIADWVRAPSRAAARERLAVYARMYFVRLHGSLAEDFPAVVASLGTEAFQLLAAEYLARHHSTAPTLRDLGRALPGFLTERALPRPDLGELALLEWARLEAFDAADVEPLTMAALSAHASEAWPALHLGTVPGMSLVRTRFAVEDVWLAADRDQPLPTPEARQGHVVVWKHQLIVRHRRLEAHELGALELAQDGTTLAALCERLAPSGLADDETSQIVFQRFGRLIADGILRSR